MGWSIIPIVMQLIFLEGILSIDNAAVLGAMAASLPGDKPIPWPAWLNGVKEPAGRILGNQREAVLRVGLLGAYMGRFLMLLMATFIAHNPWLRLLGAIYLVYLAVEYLAHADHEDASSTARPQAALRSAGFWATVLAVELADLAFSLDNVVAAIMLSDKLWVVMVGMGLGIVTMRFAATIFARLILWEQALQTGAYLLVLALGVELLLKELLHFTIGEFMQFTISVTILVMTVLVARSPLPRQPLLRRGTGVLFQALYLPFGFIVWLLQVVTTPILYLAANL